jgi:hypothetical protein
MTDWRGGVRQASVQITSGVNCSSPLADYGTKSDRMLFIRTNVDIKDGSTGMVAPMAFYRRANRTIMKSYGKGKKTRNPVYRLRTFSPKDEVVIQFSPATVPKNIAGDVPIVRQPYDFVIEVRKDGTPHPHA